MRSWLVHIVLLFIFIPKGVHGQSYANTDAARDTITIQIEGSMDDSRFIPSEAEIRKGDVLRFVVTEGVHTVTAYHPDNRRELAIPETATPFDSDLLQKGQEWYYRPEVTGEYNYFCRPHERMGHKGKFIVR